MGYKNGALLPKGTVSNSALRQVSLCQIYLSPKSEEAEILLVLPNVYILINDAHYVLHQFFRKFQIPHMNLSCKCRYLHWS